MTKEPWNEIKCFNNIEISLICTEITQTVASAVGLGEETGEGGAGKAVGKEG